MGVIRTDDGVELFYRDWAAEEGRDGCEGRPILFVSSWSLTSDAWAYQMLPLRKTASEPPHACHVLRLSLHPGGLAGRIGNWTQWRAHVLSRLTRQIDGSADPVLAALRDELQGYPTPAGDGAGDEDGHHPDVVVPLRLHSAAGMLSLFGTTTVFGTAVDITLSELAIEAFFPADAETADRLRRALA